MSNHCKMNDYQQEQWDALSLVMHQIGVLNASQRALLAAAIAPYLAFRQQVDQFLATHFAAYCTQSCFENGLSACCSKDGIITFWADAVVNALVADEKQMEKLRQAQIYPFLAQKCIYLGPRGCRWQVRPLMCAMFLCDPVQAKVFAADRPVEEHWRELVNTAKGYRWPDRPVLFDWLELYFMNLGCRSPLMYINTSPGLMRIKRLALEAQGKPFVYWKEDGNSQVS